MVKNELFYLPGRQITGKVIEFPVEMFTIVMESFRDSVFCMVT